MQVGVSLTTLFAAWLLQPVFLILARNHARKSCCHLPDRACRSPVDPSQLNNELVCARQFLEWRRAFSKLSWGLND
jgi:hypothetical protein